MTKTLKSHGFSSSFVSQHWQLRLSPSGATRLLSFGTSFLNGPMQSYAERWASFREHSVDLFSVVEGWNQSLHMDLPATVLEAAK
ncbi:hypothetical protein ACFE33_04375 [Falsihalocynthiibacter sp. SS001]|uniref:hypothetical protein n=1 Tax=Falsihalocynthiibacter sp. SS001 TaxID=3349698 RepID=UPI0036D3ABFA